ncbi:MAG: peptidase E [Rickettsiales bacterium]|jgi:dipeptidase E|nr:peptidase E [Rickettsiales bacterium]
MKAILASTEISKIDGGILLAEKLTGKSRKNLNIAVINEASAMEFGDHRFVIEYMRDLADNFGGNIEIMHLLALTPEQMLERMDAADMLCVLGGNTEWLKIVFDESGFSAVLPEMLDTTLYVGSSAGSMILGHLSSYENQDEGYGPAPHFGVDRYLDLADFAILPHFHAEYINNRGDDWVIAESKSSDYPVYAISDHAAVVIDGENVSVIGKDYIKLSGGK